MGPPRLTEPTALRFDEIIGMAVLLVASACSACQRPVRASLPRPPVVGIGVGAVAKAGDGTDHGSSRESPFPVWASSAIDSLVTDVIARGGVVGAVVVAGTTSGVVYERAFGARATVPAYEPMTEDTIFDLASLTKPLATTTSIALLAEDGRLRFDEPLATYFPGCAFAKDERVTVRALLTHTSGLPPDIPRSRYEAGTDAAIAAICGATVRPPGEAFVYSDAGFVLLGELVRRVSGTGLDAFSRARIFEPLGMGDTEFLPAPSKLPRIGPTEPRDGRMIRGVVHDPVAFRLGGVAGHAGLFGTARDVARYAQMVLGQGEIPTTAGVRRLMERVTVRQLFAPHDVPGGIRALGWDVQSSFSQNRPAGFSRRSVGHTGFTGTSLFIDRQGGRFVVLLTHRVHPDGRGNTQGLAARVGQVVADALPVEPTSVPDVAVGQSETRTSPPSGSTAGIDALLERAELFPGRRLALLTNDASRTATGARVIDALASRLGPRLVALLSAEHGLAAKAEGAIADARDAATGLPVFSLYGDRQALPAEILGKVDTVLVDLQDVGVRYYTYAGTMKRVMADAATNAIGVVVLDRPNPLGGVRVLGPTRRSTKGTMPMPILHGMTMGELAEMFLAEDHLPLDLTVIPLRGWSRSSAFDGVWHGPSPNLPTLRAVAFYPRTSLVEATNVSVGRGTSMPFEVVGAPYIDKAQFSRDLQARLPQGVLAEPVEFVPDVVPFRGKVCKGVRLRVQDESVDPLAIGVALAQSLLGSYPQDYKPDGLVRLLEDSRLVDGLRAGQGITVLQGSWAKDLAQFRAKREKYLLYGMTPELSADRVP
jgi:uncharacterized protein YbbC (DUF1343 family)/CubicO group peptidase (beta-lactamase class C family)